MIGDRGGDRLKRLACRGLLATVLATPVPSRSLAQEWPPANWTEAVEPVRIADDLYYVGTAGLAAFLLVSDEGHILIDAPLAVNVPLILDNVRALGFDPSDIRVLVASHAHFDHVGGVAAMLEATGADLVLSEADAVFVREGRDFGLGELEEGYPPATPDRIVNHLSTVRVGDIELTAHLTPGHTPGCTTWSGEVRIEGDPHTFVTVCSLSVLAGYVITGDDATYPGQAHDYCRSVAHLESLDPDIFLAAHPGWFGFGPKRRARAAGDAAAFVERDRYREYLAAARAAIETRLEEEGVPGGCEAVLGSEGTP